MLNSGLLVKTLGKVKKRKWIKVPVNSKVFVLDKKTKTEEKNSKVGCDAVKPYNDFDIYSIGNKERNVWSTQQLRFCSFGLF